MPHLDPVEQIEKRKGSPLTEMEASHLLRRIASARLWVDQYAGDEEKTQLQTELPARAQELSHSQRAFLHLLADELAGNGDGEPVPWEDDALQGKIFEVARMTPLEQALAFKALYRVLLDRESGPKAGNLLAFLDRDFVVTRCRELPVHKEAFWRESAVTFEALEQWMSQQRDKITATHWKAEMHGGTAAIELTIEMKDGKRQLKRVLLKGLPSMTLHFA
jgi:lysyl-tRNA synthetase class 1